MSKCICGEINARNCPVHNDMSDSQRKPREFWIKNNENNYELKEVYTDEKNTLYIGKQTHHVIEMSAYDSLLKEAMAMRAQLVIFADKFPDQGQYKPKETIEAFDKWLEENKPQEGVGKYGM